VPTALETRNSVTIEAPIEKIWDAITTPTTIKQWFFGVDTESDWTEGSPIVHTGEWKGKPYEDKGTIVAIEPPRSLVHTHWSSFSGLPDSEENYQTVTWTLTGRNGGTELTVSETNLPNEEMKSTSESSWQMVLRQLKDLLEKG
jgi:uncharacterized protein YndB with AHSA1/START domain